MNAVFLGMVFGILASVSPGTVFIGVAAWAVGYCLWRFGNPPHRRFLVALFLSAFFLRVAVSLGLDALSWKIEGERPFRDGPVQGWNLHISDKTRGYLKIGDSDYSSQRGYATAEFVKGSNEPVLPFRINQYGRHGYITWIGWFYYLFGFSPCAVKLINCLLGSLVAVLVFGLGRGCFSQAPARWASILTVFFPSLILWSATNLKEIPFTFFTLLTLLFYSRLTQAQKTSSRLLLILLLGGSLAAHMSLRSTELSTLLGGSLLVAHLLPRLLRSRPISTITVLLVLLIIGLAVSFWEPVGYLLRRVLMVPFNWHIGFVTTPGSSYTFLPAEFYKEGYRWTWVETGRMNAFVLSGMMLAVAHYLFEPFPWKMRNFLQWFSFPQMILWYLLFPFVVIGVLQGLRKRQENTMALLLTTMIFVIGGSLANGNIGTLFRQRDMVTPLYLILGCVGMCETAFRYQHAGWRVFITRLLIFQGKLRRGLLDLAWKIKRKLPSTAWVQSLRLRPLYYAGTAGIAALVTHGIMIPILGLEIAHWGQVTRITLFGIAVLAFLTRVNGEQLRQGSWLLQFLKQP